MTSTRTLASHETDPRKKQTGQGGCSSCLQSRATCRCGTSKGSGATAAHESSPRHGHDFSAVPVGSSAVAAKPASKRNAAATGQAAAGEPGATLGQPQQAEQLQQSFPDLPGNPSACVVSAAMPNSRSGIKRSSSGSVREDFDVKVEWQNDPDGGEDQSYCAAGCGEYHQYVMGYMKMSSNKDGSDLKDIGGTVFGGVALDPNKFNEDGRDDNKKARYGHRDEKQTMNESYSPTREHGTLYVGKDSPGVFIGTYADFDLWFYGKLVDKCQGTETLSEPWEVAYRGVIRP